MIFKNPRNYKEVNRIHDVNKTQKGWSFKRKDDGPEIFVPMEHYNTMLLALRKLVGTDYNKFGYIPARAIINRLNEVDQEFHQKQDTWLTKNPHLRNTESYSEHYHHVLLIMNHIDLIRYYKNGNIEINPTLLDKRKTNILELEIEE